MAGFKNRELIIELKSGNSKAFEKLFFLYHKKVFGLALKYLNNQLDAEGIVQNVFIKVWENRAALDANQSISAYLFKIAKNLTLNEVKRRLCRDVYINYLQDKDNPPYDLNKEIAYNEFAAYLYKCIDSLPERRREIFLLNRHEGLTYKQIAEKLGISENTVDKQIRNSLDYLRGQLKNYLDSNQ